MREMKKWLNGMELPGRMGGIVVEFRKLPAIWIFCASEMPVWCGAVAQLGARLDGIEEVVGSNPIGSTKFSNFFFIFQTSLLK